MLLQPHSLKLLQIPTYLWLLSYFLHQFPRLQNLDKMSNPNRIIIDTDPVSFAFHEMLAPL